ncbi:MAG: oligosaccharide flippase family protein [Bryobacteraceae bacterium]
MAQPSVASQAVRAHGERFILNVLWSWTGVAASFFTGFVITPIVIRKLGPEHYGIWLQVFSILDYFWFFDLGFQPAIANFCARFLAVKDHEKINQVINTALFYFSMIAVAIWVTAPILAIRAARFFKVAEADRHEFSTLILITGLSWGLQMMLHLFLSALDGFQRFDLTSRVMVLQVALRSAGYFIVLQLGYGLLPMAEIYIAAQLLGYGLNFMNFRRVFPQLRLGPQYVNRTMFGDILRYGLKSFVASGSTLALSQSGTLTVGHYLGEAAVGYFGLPSRMLQQAADIVSRIGMVTRSSAAELTAKSKREATISLGVYANRYSLTLFMPLAVFLLVYGHPLLIRWVHNAAMAAASAPLLPIFLLSYSLVLAAQFSSSSLLYGVGRHGGYARGLVVEAVLYMAALVWVVPRYGILGAAWVSATLMIAVRGIYTPWLVCRALNYSFIAYMRRIYVRPLVAGAPAVALAWALRSSWLPGNTWAQLVAAGCVTSLAYGGLALFICVTPSHRSVLLSRLPVIGPFFHLSRA